MPNITESTNKSTKIEIRYDLGNSLSRGIKLMENAEKIDIIGDKEGPYIFIENEIYKKNLLKARKRGSKIRYITEITKKNLTYCK